jgi:hypothetical protein
MKHPVGIFGCGRGFSLWRERPRAHAEREPCDRAGLIIGLRRNQLGPCGANLGERCIMPAWMEILINVIGYAGFVAVATYHRSPDHQSGRKFPDR